MGYNQNNNYLKYIHIFTRIYALDLYYVAVIMCMYIHLYTYLWSDTDGNNLIIPKNTKNKNRQYL